MKKIVALYMLFVLISLAMISSAESFETEYGVAFGMTPQEVQEIETRNGNASNGTFTGSNAYQLYYDKDIHFHSLRCVRMEYDFDINNHLLFQVYYVSKGGAADFLYMKSVLGAQYGDPLIDESETGTYSLHYEQFGKDDGHIDVAHWIVSELNLGIDLWNNDYETVFVNFYDTTNLASYGAEPKYYSDETGITFPYMDGWDESPFSLNPQKIGFTLRRDTQSIVTYIQMDLWPDLEEYLGAMGFMRSDLGADFLEDYIVTMLMQPIEIQNLRTIVYNGIKYRVFEYQTAADWQSSSMFDCTTAMTVRDGYLHMFTLSSVSKHDQLMPDFEKLLGTVEFSK